MDSSNTQKILGYFIEEAKEHLGTLEKGIVDLANTVKDSEQINEMFRAAHSVKGGAAMLGYSSIQKVAHRLEDAFKILRENYVQVDQKLESLLLKGYDLLHDLVDQLQSPLGLEDERVKEIVAESEPTFTQLQDHLSLLLNSSGREVPTPVGIGDWSRGGGSGDKSPPPPKTPVGTKDWGDWGGQSRQLLREMLQLFKQEANEASRQNLQKVCHQLAQLAPEETKWQELVKLAQKAIANPKHSYLTLAPVVITSLKRGSDLIETEQAEALSLNPELKQLAHSQLPLVLVTLEPRAAAETMSQLFSPQQLSQLVQILQQQV